MTWWGVWSGGASYAPPALVDAQVFTSCDEAVRALVSRRRNSDGRTPCVDDATTMHLYAYDPATHRDPYPSFVLTLGPRGGVRKEVV